MLTWETLTELEPKLLDLEQEIRQEVAYDRDRWYKYYKRRMRTLVGWDREKGPEVLQTCQAYDVAYFHLYKILDSKP